jgi:hypothetical protein
MDTAWIRCKVRPGMFPSERLVVIEHEDGSEHVSMFVDERLVQAEGTPTRDRPVDGLVRVLASTEGDRAKVMLPESTVVHGRFISVPIDLVAQV